MEIYEFTAQVMEDGQLEIPSEVAQKLPRGQVVQVSLTIPENGPAKPVQGVPLGELMKYAGTISDEDAQLMLKAIEAECERVDLNEWQ
jgi:hypothetical protein